MLLAMSSSKLYVSTGVYLQRPRLIWLLSQETDKATIDVEAQDDGILAKIIVRRIQYPTLLRSDDRRNARLQMALRASPLALRSQLSARRGTIFQARTSLPRRLQTRAVKPNPPQKKRRLSPPKLSRHRRQLNQNLRRRGRSCQPVTASSLRLLPKRLLWRRASHCPR